MKRILQSRDRSSFWPVSHRRSALYVQQQCNNVEMPAQSAEPALSEGSHAFFQCWPHDPSGSRLGLVFFCHLLEQLLEIRAVAQRIQIGVGLANFETGKAVCHGAVKSGHGTRPINLAAQAISGAELGLIVRRGGGWASADQRNAKREI